MKRYNLLGLLALFTLAFSFDAFSQGQISRLPVTFPRQFTEIGNPHNAPAVSTGYYFVDQDFAAPDAWKPQEQIADTNVEKSRWWRVIPGPRIVPESYWSENKDEGLRFFRNPAVQGSYSFFDHEAPLIDSTDEAIAGPIPLKLIGNFYFNGIRYDSFYVSTNGLIALTNRRYFYDSEGARTIPTGETTAYDPMSMDWFVSTAPGNGGSPSENRGRVGTGLTDPVGDDFGYKFAVLGGAYVNNGTQHTFGIRSPLNGTNGGKLSNMDTDLPGGTSPFDVNHKGAIIAPLWADMQLSQFSKTTLKLEDHGKVYYKRSIDGRKLIIYYVQAQGRRTWATSLGPTVTLNQDMRPGDNNYVDASFQVVLNNRDSSITYVYDKFTGFFSQGFRIMNSSDAFRWNGSAGVRGFARHVNYNRSGGPQYPWAAEYEVFTKMFRMAQVNADYPRNKYAVVFKQWQNTLRVVDIQYRIRKQDPGATLDFTETVPTSQVNNYELLAGDERLGALQPVAIMQQLTNDIQGPTGVNFVQQDLVFQARFRITNLATNRIVYNRLVPVDHTCLSITTNWEDCTGDPDTRVRFSNVTASSGNYTATSKPYPGTNSWNGKVRNGIPAYEFVQVYFPPYEPNEFATDINGKFVNIGRLKAFIIADPTSPSTGEKLGDEWPFDDTTSVNLFVMRRLETFIDDVREYHLIENTPMPSVLKWVNIDAEVVGGENVSRHPLPPRGEFAADNNVNFKRRSPVILMNRKQLNGLDHAQVQGDFTGMGDELRSFPVDMRGKKGASLVISVQRTLDKADWARGFGDNQLVGPEPRVVRNNNIFNSVTVNTAFASFKPDWLGVLFARPSDNRVSNITNIAVARWRSHVRRQGAPLETNQPALRVYGAGGYEIGFLETDPDSALAPVNPALGFENSLRPNLYDDGYDFEYKTYFVPIPDTIALWPNDGAKNFRFKVKVFAGNDQKCVTCIPDDNDDFLVDNIRILFKTSEATDISVTSVKALWPYTQAPATQATNIPVRVKVSNNTTTNAPFYYVRLRIYKDYIEGDTSQKPIYCRNLTVPDHPYGIEKELDLPSFNARQSGPGKYRFIANIVVPGGDLEEMNDTTFHDFTINFGGTFAYDNVASPSNDVNSVKTGTGLRTEAYAEGGTANYGSFIQLSLYDEIRQGCGYVGGSISGQIATKFELLQADTIYGYQAYFGIANSAPDAIAFAIYSDQNNYLPNKLIQESLIFKERGRSDVKNGLFFNEYVDYRFPNSGKIVLQPGVYWMTISQMAETGLELGASASRAGMRTMSINHDPLDGEVKAVGNAGLHLNIHKEFRRLDASGRLLNNNHFAVENVRTNGVWLPFQPTAGNPAYAHLHHYGLSPVDLATLTQTRGTWIPMIRPFLGVKSFTTKLNYVECDPIPVELTSFNGYARSAGLDLFWETASETNNKGFFVERLNMTQNETAWAQVAFVPGAVNSTTVNRYNYTDKNVSANNTYQYKLRQVDLDGTQNCNESQIVTLTFGDQGGLALYQNSPNPFAMNTSINFFLPEGNEVTVEVVDMFGSVVKTLANNSSLTAGNHKIDFDGTDNSSKPLPSGTYIYRVRAGNETASAKMSIVK